MKLSAIFVVAMKVEAQPRAERRLVHRCAGAPRQGAGRWPLRESDGLEKRLAFLATSPPASPFIGLLARYGAS